MAESVFTNPFLSVGGVDLSDHVRQVTLNYSAGSQDKTRSGNDTRNMIAGLKNWSIDVEFNQDYAASEVDATLFPLVGAAEFAVILRPDQGVVGTANPQYTGNAILENYQPMGGGIGDMHVAPASLVSAGTLARATS